MWLFLRVDREQRLGRLASENGAQPFGLLLGVADEQGAPVDLLGMRGHGQAESEGQQDNPQGVDHGSLLRMGQAGLHGGSPARTGNGFPVMAVTSVRARQAGHEKGAPERAF